MIKEVDNKAEHEPIDLFEHMEKWDDEHCLTDVILLGKDGCMRRIVMDKSFNRKADYFG